MLTCIYFQGFSNLQAFQDQLKNITILSKNVSDTSLTTSSLTTSTLVNDDTSQFVTTSDTSFPISQPVRLFDITTPPTTEVSANTDGSLLPETVLTGEMDGATIVIQSRIPAQDVTDTAIDNAVDTLTTDTLTADTPTDAQDTQSVTAVPIGKPAQRL